MTTVHRFGAADVDDRDYCCVIAAVDFRIAGVQYKRFTLGFSPDGRPARKAYCGPLHAELFGWLNPQPTVIDAHPITPRSTVEIAVGDFILIDDFGAFRVQPGDRDHAATLEAVHAANCK